MILKMTSIVFIFFSTTIFGFHFANRSVYKLKDFKQLLKALIILETEIKYGYETLIVATKKISEKIDEPISLIFEEFSKKLQEKIFEDINSLWCESIEDFKDKLYFNEDEIHEIKSLSKILDNIEMDLQIKNILLLKNYLEKEINELQIVSYKEAKMYKSISILGSLLILVLLI